MGRLSDFILKAIASFKPFQISINNPTVKLGGQDYKVENGNIIFDIAGTETSIPLVKGEDGLYRPKIKGTELEGLADAKVENVKNLDQEGKIFTRADLGKPQLELLSPDKSGHALAKKLKPLIGNNNGGRDMAALVAAIAIVRVEDQRDDLELSISLHESFKSAFSARGAMIYNLLRSKILEGEVLNTIDKLARSYKGNELAVQFIIYWNSILDRGYPTAYFVRRNDNAAIWEKELRWRLDAGVTLVRLFSRTGTRNKSVTTWAATFAKDNGLQLKEGKPYDLGFSPAVKLTLYNKKKKAKQ